MKLLFDYQNGNYRVLFFDNGTKYRILNNGETEFKPEFPENIDLKISNYCHLNCPFCAEGSSKNGEYADIFSFLTSPLFNSLHKGTELAIGGGALSELPSTMVSAIFEACNKRGIIPNFTFNIKEKEIESVIGKNKTYGIGISYNREMRTRLFDLKKKFPYMVVHTILGLATLEDYQWLGENGFSVLVLGYKNIRRGNDFRNANDAVINERKNEFIEHFQEIRNSIKKLSFDCLAVEQLNLKNLVSKEEWDRYYMGDDGEFTMFIDLVEHNYGKNSTTPISERKNFSENQTIDSLFKSLKN